MRTRALFDALLLPPLPSLFCLYFFVPPSVHLIVLLGMVFTLPPGPLCDEGMVLFMEGGCDWGDSNIFFFSKLGALVSVNLALVLMHGRAPVPARYLLPHILVLGGLGWLFRSGGRCDTYYSHPNGSIGQMALEIAAFAILGIALVPAVRRASRVVLALTLVAWNSIHVLTFYAWLRVTDHWTWPHTWLVCSTLIGLAIGFTAFRAARGRSPAPDLA